MTPEQFQSLVSQDIRSLASRQRTRSWQSWCDAMTDDMREKGCSEAEITEAFRALSRLRLLAQLLASNAHEEGKNLPEISAPEPGDSILERIQEAISDALGLSCDACHVAFDEQA